MTQNNITEQNWKDMFSIAIQQRRDHKDKKTLAHLIAYRNSLRDDGPIDSDLVGARNAIELTCHISPTGGFFLILSRNHESLFIEFIFVVKEHRRKQYATKLMMTTMSRYWKQHKIGNVGLRSYKNAIKFWEKLGMTHMTDDPRYMVKLNGSMTWLMTINYHFEEDEATGPPQVMASEM